MALQIPNATTNASQISYGRRRGCRHDRSAADGCRDCLRLIKYYSRTPLKAYPSVDGPRYALWEVMRVLQKNVQFNISLGLVCTALPLPQKGHLFNFSFPEHFFLPRKWPTTLDKRVYVLRLHNLRSFLEVCGSLAIG